MSAIAGGHRNQIRERLRSGVFVYTLEHVPALTAKAGPALAELRRNAERVARDDRVAGLNIGDRVRGLDSLDTVECGLLAAEASGKTPLLHLAGKDRTPEAARNVILGALSKDLDNLLLITGDGVQKQGPDRVRYQESVLAIRDARSASAGALIAAAVNPFKYREEELANQYLKMAKKINVGADYLITNCGWDPRKFQELAWYARARGFRVPLVANLLLPTLGWAKAIHARRLPGVFMSEDLLRLIVAEHDQGTGRAAAAARRRLALQVVGVRHLGYAGVHLSGVERHEDLSEIIEIVDELGQDLPDLEAWQAAWDRAHTLPGGVTARFGPADALYLFDRQPQSSGLRALPHLEGSRPSVVAQAKYLALQAVHRVIFGEGPSPSKLAGSVVRGLQVLPQGVRAIESLEHASKRVALGCETCGTCRIHELSYICPETCPKGLVNGPCAGSEDNLCEFKDRECIHTRRYQLAKRFGRLEDLERALVPAAVTELRGTSSWLNHFGGRTPKVVWLTRIDSA